MTYEEAKAEQKKMEELGLMCRIDIVIFGKTEEEHIYTVVMIY